MSTELYLTRFAGLDSSARRPLDRACPISATFWHRVLAHIHGRAELYRRRVRDIRGKCHGSCEQFSVSLRCCLALRSKSDVRAAWRGVLSLLMAIIPFIFIRYGDRVRANSKFCQELKQKKDSNEAERSRRRAQETGVQRTSEDVAKQA
jgi:hypothetical protein